MTAQALAHPDHEAPMMDMNTTPLIDVMLVLLIMFIVTIPIQTHSVKMDLPGTITPPPIVEPLKNKIVIDERGGVLWNGRAVDLTGLSDALRRSQDVRPAPELHIQPVAEAPYARVDEVLATAKRVGVANLGFVGNERYRRF